MKTLGIAILIHFFEDETKLKMPSRINLPLQLVFRLLFLFILSKWRFIFRVQYILIISTNLIRSKEILDVSMTAMFQILVILAHPTLVTDRSSVLLFCPNRTEQVN